MRINAEIFDAYGTLPSGRPADAYLEGMDLFFHGDDFDEALWILFRAGHKVRFTIADDGREGGWIRWSREQTAFLHDSLAALDAGGVRRTGDGEEVLEICNRFLADAAEIAEHAGRPMTL